MLRLSIDLESGRNTAGASLLFSNCLVTQQQISGKLYEDQREHRYKYNDTHQLVLTSTDSDCSFVCATIYQDLSP